MKAKTAVILAWLAFPFIAAAAETSEAWSEDNVLIMNLELISIPSNDLQRAQIKLTVTNAGTNDIVLDKHLAAGFSLRFKTDMSAEFVRTDGKDVSSKEVEKLEKPKPETAAARFISLKPKESLSKLYDLSLPVRIVQEGHVSDMDSVHYGFYYESMVRYLVPPGTGKLLVDAWYERGVWMMATPQFKEWYGQTPEKIGIWRGRARSNTLIIHRK